MLLAARQHLARTGGASHGRELLGGHPSQFLQLLAATPTAMAVALITSVLVGILIPSSRSGTAFVCGPQLQFVLVRQHSSFIGQAGGPWGAV